MTSNGTSAPGPNCPPNVTNLPRKCQPCVRYSYDSGGTFLLDHTARSPPAASPSSGCTRRSQHYAGKDILRQARRTTVMARATTIPVSLTTYGARSGRGAGVDNLPADTTPAFSTDCGGPPRVSQLLGCSPRAWQPPLGGL